MYTVSNAVLCQHAIHPLNKNDYTCNRITLHSQDVDTLSGNPFSSFKYLTFIRISPNDIFLSSLRLIVVELLWHILASDGHSSEVSQSSSYTPPTIVMTQGIFGSTNINALPKYTYMVTETGVPVWGEDQWGKKDWAGLLPCKRSECIINQCSYNIHAVLQVLGIWHWMQLHC